MQLACDALGGRVDSVPAREYGRARCHVVAHDPLLAGVPEVMDVWMSHGDQVTRVSSDFVRPGAYRKLPDCRRASPTASRVRPAVPS